ncbi:MAG TPA: septum formation family protein [Acidimicrobiales bacterium]
MPVRNRTLSLLGLAVLAIAVAGGLGACGSDSDEPARDEDTDEVTEAGDADVFEMAVGDCLVDQSLTGEVTEVPVVPCDQPHASEIFYSHIIDGDTLPDPTAMEAIVDEQCVGNFEGFVGMPYEQSVLEVTWLEPTAGSWDAGDRELLCMVADPAGDVTGSLAGVAR